MNFVRDMSIATKLKAAFGLLLALLVLVAVFAYSRLDQVQAEAHEVSGNWLPSVRYGGALRGDLADYRITVYQHTNNAQDPALVEKASTRMAAAEAVYQKDEAQYVKLISSEEERGFYNSLHENFSRYQASAQRIAALVKEGKLDEAKALQSGAASTAYTAANQAINDIVELNLKGADDSIHHSEEVYQHATFWLATVSVIAAAIAVLMAVQLIKGIIGPLLRAMQAADRVADGDLSQPIEFQGSTETARLLESMQRMQQSLLATVSSVRTGADSVATASAQIAQGNADLSTRTEEQASSLEETSATMEELNATVRQNADNAAQANQLAQSASQVAREGGQVVSEVVTTMRGIETSSKRIADIITVIDGIAFQTNILALNAAVEAARAGEQGRGFAVVAGEVRSLAQRSAEAAKEIKGLISDSVSRVQDGTQLVDRAGLTIQDIVTSVQKLADLVGEISSASREQSSGINQVGEVINQLDRATQQNAALVEQSAAASESLKTQAAQLLAAVASFKLALTDRTVLATPAPRAKAHASRVVQASPARTFAAPKATAKPPASAPIKPAARPPAAPGKAAVARPGIPAPAASHDADGDWTSF